MEPFQNLFEKSEGKPVLYKGRLIHMFDDIPVHDGQELTIQIESTNSKWRQGIGFETDEHFVIEGMTIPKQTALWEDTAPNVVDIQVFSDDGKCMVKNLWDTGDGVIEAWHNGAAMIIEDIPNGRRYRCNDGYPDDDFDDIVFTIEWDDEGR